MGFNYFCKGLVCIPNICFKWGQRSKILWFRIIIVYCKMTHYFMSTSYLCEVAHDICYQWSIENNLFISFITIKGMIAQI